MTGVGDVLRNARRATKRLRGWFPWNSPVNPPAVWPTLPPAFTLDFRETVWAATDELASLDDLVIDQGALTIICAQATPKQDSNRRASWAMSCFDHVIYLAKSGTLQSYGQQSQSMFVNYGSISMQTHARTAVMFPWQVVSLNGSKALAPKLRRSDGGYYCQSVFTVEAPKTSAGNGYRAFWTLWWPPRPQLTVLCSLFTSPST